MIDVPLKEHLEHVRVAAESARARGAAVVLLPVTVQGILGALEVLGLPNTPDGRASAIISIGSEGQPVAFDSALRRVGGAPGAGGGGGWGGELEPRVFDPLARDTFEFRSQDGFVLVPAAELDEKLAWVRYYRASDGHHRVPRAEWDAWANATVEGPGWAPEDELAVLDLAAQGLP